MSPHSLSPTAVRRYDLKSQVKTFVNKKKSEFKTHLQLQTTLLGTWQHTHHHYQVEQLSSVYDNRPLLDPLVELGNLLNKRLDIVSNRHLYLTDLYRSREFYEQWRWGADRERFISKHQNNPHLAQFLAGFEQQLQNGQLAPQLRHKGFLGILFPGLLGYQGSFSTTKVLTDFLGPGLNLPLLLSVEQHPQPDGSLLIEAQGQLNKPVFDQKSFQRLIRDMVDAPNFQIDFVVAFRERYTVEAQTQQLVRGTQHLRAMVQGVYLSEVIQELTPLVA